jgi:hypothetical protein
MRIEGADFKEPLPDPVPPVLGLLQQPGLFQGLKEAVNVGRRKLEELAGFPDAHFRFLRGEKRKQAGDGLNGFGPLGAHGIPEFLLLEQCFVNEYPPGEKMSRKFHEIFYRLFIILGRGTGEEGRSRINVTMRSKVGRW